ncbi:MAG: formylglycine-generating enzyme family protein [Sandaracinaceae bacterium]
MNTRLWATLVTALLALPGCDEAPAPVEPPTCPAQMVHLPELEACIDRYEAALDRVGTSARAISAEGRLPEGDITFPEARAACAQSGYRLCGVEEWYFACSGVRVGEEGGRPFPYGEEFEAGRCNSVPDDEAATGREVLPGGARQECQSPEGVFDLSGNVSEWVVSEREDLREVRGGNFGSYERYAHCATTPPAYHPAEFHTESLGFRCCTDAR